MIISGNLKSDHQTAVSTYDTFTVDKYNPELAQSLASNYGLSIISIDKT
jgi:hypothetical protein